MENEHITRPDYTATVRSAKAAVAARVAAAKAVSAVVPVTMLEVTMAATKVATAQPAIVDALQTKVDGQKVLEAAMPIPIVRNGRVHRAALPVAGLLLMRAAAVTYLGTSTSSFAMIRAFQS